MLSVFLCRSRRFVRFDIAPSGNFRAFSIEAPMIYRLFDPEILEVAVAEQAPDLVRGFTARDWLADPNVVVLTDGSNIAIFEAQEEPGVFYGHTIFRERGRGAIIAGRKIIKFLAAVFGARTIKGETPLEKRAARWFARQLGFRSGGFKSTPAGEVEQFVMECIQCHF